MDRRRYRLGITVLIMISILGVGCGGGADTPDTSGESPSWSRDPEMIAVEIVVDLRSAHDGRIPVQVTSLGGRPTHFAIQSAWSDGYAVHDLRFTDDAGRVLPHREERGRYRVEKPEGDVVKALYEMELGGKGRHGNQGVVAVDHAMFDGRLFLLPQGAVSIGSARIRFDAPDGWTVASPFRADDSWYYVDAFGPELTALVLGASCMGVGRFDHSTRRVGETEVRVASYTGWEDGHKQILADHTFRMLEYFHDTLGFDLRAPYSVVWVPKQGRDRVFGGSFANGTCYENPTGRLRNWELLAHRIAHAVNHYRPSGMRIRDDRDSWFDEGWASYMEATATRATGLAESDSRWSTLHNTYVRRRAQSPEIDLPLSREKQARGATREFLHYVKAPLAVKMLEYLVLSRSEHDLEQFMASIGQRYGWFEGTFSLREELETFTGASFDDFWSLMVDSKGGAIPVWDDYLTPLRLRFMKSEPAATVGDEPLQGEYLYHLARSGDFRTFGEIREFLVEEQIRRTELAARGIQFYPDAIREHLYALAAEDRYAVARLEAAYPLDLPRGAELRFVANTEQEDGRIFAALLAHERRDDAPETRGTGPWIEVRTESPPRSGKWRSTLAFPSGIPIEVSVSRLRDVESAEVAVLSNDHEATVGRFDVGAAGGARATIGAEDRPSGNRVIVLRWSAADGEAVARAFWQRSGVAPTRIHSASPEPS